MNLQIANPEDSDRISAFYRTQIETGYFDYQLTRDGSFFAPYKAYSDDCVTYMLVDDSGAVHAVASLIFREGVLNGERQIIGYATDLQVSNNRAAILNWSNHFLPILLHEREKRNCKYVFTVLTQAHQQAYNAFVRPRSPKRRLPRYHLYRRFQLVSLHGRLPLAPTPLETIVTRPGTEKDRKAIYEYIAQKSRQLPLHYYETPEDVDLLLQRWTDFKIENFILALDYLKNIVGCVLPWFNSHHQRMTVQRYKGGALTLYQGLKLFSFMGYTRPLPRPNHPLQFHFLTHFYFDNPDIFDSLLQKAWSTHRHEPFITYCHFKDNFLTRLPKSYVKSKIGCGLYCLLAPEDPIPDFLKLAQIGKPPDFDPILL